MKKTMTKVTAFLVGVTALISSLLLTTPVSAADTLYDSDFETIAKVGEANSCYSAQGMAVGDTHLYFCQIGDDDSRAIVHRIEIKTGDRELMYYSETGNSYFDHFGHANDLDWARIDGVEYLFVLADSKLLMLRIDGDTLYPHAEYNLKYNGSAFGPGGMAIQSVSSRRAVFLFKWGRTISTGGTVLTRTTGDISVSIKCTLDVTKVTVDDEVQDFSSFVNQGMGYSNGYLFVPITGNDSDETANHSLILAYDISKASGGNSIQPDDSKTFYVISDEYAGLFEIEDCGVSADGRLYFNTNGRRSSRDTKHDAAFVLNDFVLEEALPKATYTVQYDANGGTGTMASATVETTTVITPATNTFKRDGYTFTGWTAYSALKKKNVNIGDTAAEGDTITFTAQWQGIPYTMQYDANGGTGTMASATVEAGTPIQAAVNTFKRDGYAFAGWKPYSTVQKKNLNMGDVPVNGDTVVLYAQWTKDAPTTYTVQYDANGGTGTMASATVSVDTPLAPAENGFTMEGYTFAGWKVYSTIQGRYVNIGDTAAAGDTITFTAQWEKIQPTTYTVRYDANGGTGKMDEQTVTTDMALIPAENQFRRQGCVFAGWKAVSTLTGGEVAPGDAVAADDTIVLYAQWDMYGDANGDGKLTIADAFALRMYEKGIYPIAPDRASLMDVNGDGVVNTSDAHVLFAYIVGGIETLPV